MAPHNIMWLDLVIKSFLFIKNILDYNPIYTTMYNDASATALHCTALPAIPRCEESVSFRKVAYRPTRAHQQIISCRQSFK